MCVIITRIICANITHVFSLLLYDSSVYQFSVDDECFNVNADDVDVNACAVVYISDREFGELEPIPTSSSSLSCHDLPSTKICRSRCYQTFDEISAIRIT